MTRLSVVEAEQIAASILDLIEGQEDPLGGRRHLHHDRKRIESDVKMLTEAHKAHERIISRRDIWASDADFAGDVIAYCSQSLLRLAKVYGARV